MAFASAHNGGKSQVNLSYVQTGGDYPFINHLKTAQAWTLGDNSGPALPAMLDANGYPSTISNGGVYTVFYIPKPAFRPGNWVVKWVGDGTIVVNSAHTVVAGSKTGVNGRCVITPTGDSGGSAANSYRINLGISGKGASDYIRSLAFVHVDDEAAFDAGEVFNPIFKTKLAEGGFGVIRFLDWLDTNLTNASKWEHRKPINYAFYAGYEWRSALYAGTTTNVGNDYTVAFPGFVLADKATVHVKFNADATAAAMTLNVKESLDDDGTGAIPLTASSGAADASGGQFPFFTTLWPKAGRPGTVVYDATLNKWLLRGGNLAEAHCGIANAVPPELAVQLCAETGTHPWFPTPYLAADPITDYMTQLAVYIRDNAPSWMIPRFEIPNETWNTKFPGTVLAALKANAYWGTTNDWHNWAGKVGSTLGQAISTVYGNDRTRYQVISGVQTVFGTGASTHNARLSSTRYVADGGSAAKNWVTHVACTNYFNPTYTSAAEQTAADNYAAADTAGKLAIATAFVESTALDVAGNNGLPRLKEMYQGWKAWADSFGVGLKLTAYEGSWSPDYGTGNANRDALRAASKSVEAVAYYTLLNYHMFVNAGGEFPSLLVFAGNSSVWSALDPDIYADSPSWRAIKMFNQGKRRFRAA